MIDTVEITFYQSWQTAVLKAHHGVNVIKGTSHHGKSAVFRPIKWAILNSITGFGFKSHFADPKDFTISAIGYDDGSWISRERNNKENLYRWGAPGNEENDPLKALSGKVPDEIKSITGMDARNLRSQGDGYFILDDSPGQAGKKVNKAVGLEIINEVLALANSDVSKRKHERDIVKTDIKETKEKLEALSHVPSLKTKFEELDVLISKKLRVEYKISSLQTLITNLQGSYEDVDGINKWIEGTSPQLAALQDLIAKRKDKQKRYQSLSLLITQIGLLKESIKNKEFLLEAEKPVNDILELVNKRSLIAQKRNVILGLCNAIQKSNKRVLAISEAGEKLELDKSVLEKQLDYCTKCGAHKKHWSK